MTKQQEFIQTMTNDEVIENYKGWKDLISKTGTNKERQVMIGYYEEEIAERNLNGVI